MTRKDFIAIAKVFNDRLKALRPISQAEERSIVMQLAVDMTSVLKNTNPLFDKERYLEAVTDGV